MSQCVGTQARVSDSLEQWSVSQTRVFIESKAVHVSSRANEIDIVSVQKDKFLEGTTRQTVQQKDNNYSILLSTHDPVPIHLWVGQASRHVFHGNSDFLLLHLSPPVWEIDDQGRQYSYYQCLCTMISVSTGVNSALYALHPIYCVSWRLALALCLILT